MFVRAEISVNTPFEVAQRRLTDLTRGGLLGTASEDAYDSGLTSLIRVGPLGAAPGMSKLVRVRSRDPVRHGDRLVLTLRWEAAGSGGGLFPALDADITLAPAEGGGCLLALDGAYRPPLAELGASLDRVLLHRVATATVRDLLARIATAIGEPAPDGTDSAASGQGRSAQSEPPGRPG